jgi:hypothetical protein
MGTDINHIVMNRWRELQARGHRTPEDLKSVLSVHVSFRAVSAFFGLPPRHVRPTLLQFGHPFLKGLDPIHGSKYKAEPGCLLCSIVDVLHPRGRAGERGSI